MRVGLHCEDLVDGHRGDVEQLFLRFIERGVRPDLAAHRLDHASDARPQRSRRRHRQGLLADIVAVRVIAFEHLHRRRIRRSVQQCGHDRFSAGLNMTTFPPTVGSVEGVVTTVPTNVMTYSEND